jgi:hypothetical protein
MPDVPMSEDRLAEMQPLSVPDLTFGHDDDWQHAEILNRLDEIAVRCNELLAIVKQMAGAEGS